MASKAAQIRYMTSLKDVPYLSAAQFSGLSLALANFVLIMIKPLLNLEIEWLFLS
jgi:hypothetical protein